MFKKTNQDQSCVLQSISVIYNPQLEENFATVAQQFFERAKNEDLTIKETEVPFLRSFALPHEPCAALGNPILAWHGTKESALGGISQEGFKILSDKDPGECIPKLCRYNR